MRNRSLSHGDIKSENVLVTSWNWVYLCDFASSYKPTWLPLDDPADFSFYFDVAGRRACYVAPERFYAQGEGAKEKERRRGTAVDEVEGYGYGGKREGKVTEAMDVFSAGCVIAEIFLEGTLFTLSQLFKYREGEYKVDAALSIIEDKGVQVNGILFDLKKRLHTNHLLGPYQTNDTHRSFQPTDVRHALAHLSRKHVPRVVLFFLI
jgi:phosphoinositide-3-kinase regulatory subunit 4